MASLQERVGRAVRERRESLNISQERFADKIKMHRAYYGALERGEKNLQLSTLERVCAGLSVPIAEIMRDADA